MVQFCDLRLQFDTDIDIVSRRLLEWIETQANDKIHDIQQPDEYMTDSDTWGDEEGDFEVVYSRTCMTRSGRSVRDWCVCFYEAAVSFDGDTTKSSFLYLQQQPFNRSLYGNR